MTPPDRVQVKGLEAGRGHRAVTNLEMAQSHLSQARLILDEADRYRTAGARHLAVRRSQESVALALKARRR